MSDYAGFSEARASFSFDRLDHLREVGFSRDEIHSIVGPRRTLARREGGAALSLVEADRVERLERISELADRVFGDHEKAARWLRKEVRSLNGARPIELLRSETGAHHVEQALLRIDHGIFA